MWFFRVIEHPDGSWRCHRGLEEIDAHAVVDHALSHLREIAESHRPAELFLHTRDGAVERLGVLD